MRVTDTTTHTPKACTNKEAALNWSQQGPKGDSGLPGPKGDKGDKGDPGTSHAYFVDGGGLITSTSYYGSKVAELTVPSGCQWCLDYSDSYVFSAKRIVRAHGLNVAPEMVHCQFLISSGTGSTADYGCGTVSSNASGDTMMSTLSMQMAKQIDGGTAAVYCDAPQTAEAYNVKITAVQVGSIN